MAEFVGAHFLTLVIAGFGVFAVTLAAASLVDALPRGK